MDSRNRAFIIYLLYYDIPPTITTTKRKSKVHTITVFDREKNKIQSIEVQEDNIDEAIQQANLFVRMSLNRNHFVREKYWTSVLDKLQALKKSLIL